MWTRTRIKMAVRLLCTGVCLDIAATAGAAYGQPAFVDSAQRPGVAREAPRAAPRGLNLPDLYQSDNRIETPRLDVEKLKQEDASQTQLGPLRMGVVQEVAVDSESSGRWQKLSDGGWLWAMAVHAPGAVGIRLRIRPWALPAGAELILYDAHKPSSSVGPLRRSQQQRSNELWTPTVYSDEVRIEYYLPAEIDHKAAKSRIHIDGLLNQYRNLPGMSSTNSDGQPVELSCHLDVTCYPDWANEAESVGALTYVSNPPVGGFFCSGSILNRVPTDFTPFFQTARHCGVDTQSEADSVLITWFYQTGTCNGTPPNPATLAQTSGAVLLLDDAEGDYTLLGLEPANVPNFFLGWDPNYWPNSSTATGIHHPGGTHKRITFGTKVGDVDSCIGGNTPAWSIDNGNGHGEIEPGSSGSPIFDAAHRVRGVASCASWGCSSNDGASYGRFDVVWPRVEPYLYRNDASEWDVYVDGAYTGTEWGTATQPFKGILKGAFAVRAGYHMYIKTGNYSGGFSLTKAMTLHAQNGVVRIGQ